LAGSVEDWWCKAERHGQDGRGTGSCPCGRDSATGWKPVVQSGSGGISKGIISFEFLVFSFELGKNKKAILAIAPRPGGRGLTTMAPPTGGGAKRDGRGDHVGSPVRLMGRA